MIEASPTPPPPQSAATTVQPARRFSSHAARPPTMTELTLHLHARSRALTITSGALSNTVWHPNVHDQNALRS
jgi:hypothetical protein